MKITYYCAMSSDGFIATTEGDVSWLDDLNMTESESSYESFFASVDGLAMGRGTYDFIFNYGSWPYGEVPTWVFTSAPLEPLNGAIINVIDTIDAFAQEANAQKMKHIWLVGGGQLGSSFLDKGLLTHLSITEAHIKLGAGIPLFSKHKLADINKTKIESVQKPGYKTIEIEL